MKSFMLKYLRLATTMHGVIVYHHCLITRCFTYLVCYSKLNFSQDDKIASGKQNTNWQLYSFICCKNGISLNDYFRAIRIVNLVKTEHCIFLIALQKQQTTTNKPKTNTHAQHHHIRTKPKAITNNNVLYHKCIILAFKWTKSIDF